MKWLKIHIFDVLKGNHRFPRTNSCIELGIWCFGNEAATFYNKCDLSGSLSKCFQN